MEQKIEGDTYRGIKLADGVKYNKDGSLYGRTKSGLDILADLLEQNGHRLLNEYKQGKSKVLIDFNCDHEPHFITPDDYKNGKGCPKCGRERINAALKEKSNQVGENFTVLVMENGHKLLSKYTKNTDKVLIDFNCGHDPHTITPKEYKKGKGCPKCSGSCPVQAKEDFLNVLEKNGHSLVSDYVNNTTKVKVNFNCGHELHWITPRNYKSQGQGCPKCNGVSSEQAKIDLISMLEENNHSLESEYKNAFTKVLINFNCGHGIHEITPHDYKKGRRCPNCSESKGEKAIREWLIEQGITFLTQYKFPSDNKRTVTRYDFVLPSENIVCEVHGRQHYLEVEFFNHRSLAEEQENDRIKREFVENLGYKFIEVDYREGNPELALKRFIESYNNLKKLK